MNFNELTALRADLAFIAHWVAPGSQVLDLGCGDGVMLDYLQSAKQCAGYGVEIDDAKIPVCIARNVPVIQQDMEAGLAIFADNAFDTVLCLSALQMMKNVDGVLRDRLDEAIADTLDLDVWNHAVRIEQAEVDSMQSILGNWKRTISSQAGKYSTGGLE